MTTNDRQLPCSLEGWPPPTGWPAVLHAWFEASRQRDVAGWRRCLGHDVRNIGVDGRVVAGVDEVIEAMVAYYRDIGPDERIDEWIIAADPELFIWHGTIEPGRDHETKWCTICRVRGERIVELRFFADQGTLASLWGRHA